MRARPYGQQQDGPRDRVQSESENGSVPSAAEVARLHTKSDVDARPESLHHTIGGGGSQAAAGDHNHRDGISAPLLDGITLTGSKAGANAVFLASVAAAMRELGATDSST